jgi:predicted nuclease of predicted toxin-antitoxin system
MRFLLDANLPRSATSVAKQAGDEAAHVSEVGLADAPDHVIATYARTHGLVLVTRDLDFADVGVYPPTAHAGIVVLQLSEHAIAAEICRVFGLLLAQREVVERLAGHLAVVEGARVRVRPPLE